MDRKLSPTVARTAFPMSPILLTTPPGSYESFGKGGGNVTYGHQSPGRFTAPPPAENNPPYAKDHRLLVWDMYDVVGGKRRACTNLERKRNGMRPDHVHYLPEGYILQGNLLYQAIIQAYNDYVSH